ncbi:hypothetical protein OKW43_008162 [Paraburkholderia sp. WC7.3g]
MRVSRTRLRIPQRDDFRLQPRVLRLNRIEPPLQYARLMTRVAQLRLHGVNCPAVVRILAVRAMRGFVQLFLRLRRVTSLAVDLQQGALFRCPKPLLRPMRIVPELLQFLREVRTGLRERRVAPGVLTLQPGNLRLQRLALRVRFSLRLLELPNLDLRSQQRGSPCRHSRTSHRPKRKVRSDKLRVQHRSMRPIRRSPVARKS